MPGLGQQRRAYAERDALVAQKTSAPTPGHLSHPIARVVVTGAVGSLDPSIPAVSCELGSLLKQRTPEGAISEARVARTPDDLWPHVGVRGSFLFPVPFRAPSNRSSPLLMPPRLATGPTSGRVLTHKSR